MKLSRVRRFGVVGAVVSALLGAMIIVSPSASAVESTWDCQGSQVEQDRCIQIIYNEDYRNIRARAEMVDLPGGGNFRIWLRDLKVLHQTPSGGWKVIRHEPDRDGWFDVKDVARTNTFNPCNFSDGKNGAPTFRVKATFYWRGAADGHTTFYHDGLILPPWEC